MSEFKNIEKLGLDTIPMKGLFSDIEYFVDAYKLESILQSAQVVYGDKYRNALESEWSTTPMSVDTHKAILLAIEPIKKKTKAEAALELLGKLANDPAYYSSLGAAEAKRILEIKDEV